MAVKLGTEAVDALYIGADLVDAVYLGSALSSGGGGEELPAAPGGFAYIVNADGDFLRNAESAYILGKA